MAAKKLIGKISTGAGMIEIVFGRPCVGWETSFSVAPLLPF